MRKIIATSLLWVLANNCQALGIGRVNGVVWLSQPVDITVPIRLDAGDSADVRCFQVDLFHGDTPVDASRLRLSLDVTRGASEAVLRIRSAVAVNEPVVTMELRSVCGEMLTRRFVMLPQVSSGVATPSRSAEPAASVAMPQATPAATDPGPVAAVSSAVPVRGQAKLPNRMPTAGVDRARASATESQRANSAAARPGRARLKLDLIDDGVERDPALRRSDDLLSPIDDNPQRRAEAAMWWRVINARPEDVLREAVQAQQLQAEVGGLRDQAQKNNRSIAELKSQLEAVTAERYSGGLVYSLMALLLAAVAGATYFWLRPRAATSPLWRRVGASSQSADKSHLSPSAMRDPLSSQSRPTSRIHSDFGPSDLAVNVRAISTKAIQGAQQQADFFMSLGQYDQAARVMRSHIEAKDETRPIAYLDLLKIHHKQGRREDYDRLRLEIEQVFNAQVPVFDDYAQPGRSLASYAGVVSRVELLWPSPKVRELLEVLIFRQPNQDSIEPFELQALRELLVLFRMTDNLDSGFRPSQVTEPPKSAPVPTPERTAFAEAVPVHKTVRAPIPDVVEPIYPSGLDIDLDEIAATPPTSAMAALKANRFELDQSRQEQPPNSKLLDFWAFDDTAKPPPAETGRDH